MLDTRVRARIRPAFDAAAGVLHRRGVTANQLTLVGMLLGLTAAVLSAAALWLPAAAVWLLSRIPDGLDGAVARLDGSAARSDLGGYYDLVADFLVYGAFVVGCGIGQPASRVVCLVLLLAYYVNGTSFFALATIAEKRDLSLDDASRTFRFSGGIAEGTETIVAHAAMALFSSALGWIAGAFAVLVTVTAVQRIRFTVRVLTAEAAARAASS